MPYEGSNPSLCNYDGWCVMEKPKEQDVTSEAPVKEEMDMEQLLAEAEKEAAAEAASIGTIVTATVVEVGASGVLVDVGLKAEGLIPLFEFRSLPTPPKAGDTLPVLIKKPAGPEGHALVSWLEAKNRAAWPAIQAAKDAGTALEGKVLRAVKGGLIVDVGVEGFLPASQVDRRPVRDLTGFVGTLVTVTILELDPRKGNVVLSRRAILEKEVAAKQEEAVKNIEVGKTLAGTVTGLTAFGAFVDVGGVEGLVRLPDISWARIGKPGDALKVGQKVEVKVLKFDPATKKLSLGRKQLLPHPWQNVEARFPVGTVLDGKVTNVTEFGAFVQLEPGLEGLIHKTELSWEAREVKPADALKTGQAVKVKVIAVKPAEERISLSLKRGGHSPWDDAAAKWSAGSRLKGKVVRLADFGAFIALGNGIEGLLRVEDLSWTRRIAHPKDILSVGQELDLVVLDVNPAAEKIGLGLKQTTPDPAKAFKPGTVVEGKVVRLSDHGAFVQIAPEMEAFMHISEITSDKRLNHPSEALKEGDEITAVVIKGKAPVKGGKSRRIDISERQHERQQEKNLLKQYRPSTGGVSIGEVTGWGQKQGGSETDDDRKS
jgi:small subunit ribosomal protein S1